MKQRIYIAFTLVFLLVFLLFFIQASNVLSGEIEKASTSHVMDLELDDIEEEFDEGLDYFVEELDLFELNSSRHASFFSYQARLNVFVRKLPVPPAEINLL